MAPAASCGGVIWSRRKGLMSNRFKHIGEMAEAQFDTDALKKGDKQSVDGPFEQTAPDKNATCPFFIIVVQ